MKVQKIFSGLVLSSLLMAGCSNDTTTEQEIPIAGNSYVSVNIVSPTATTRALGGTEIGSDAENEVTKAIFFFFDAAGNGCVEPVTPTLSFNNSTGNNEKISEAIVVLRDPGSQPTSVVVVLNPTNAVAALTKATTLTNLRNTVEAYPLTSPFMMSNTVFMRDGIVDDAISVSSSQICTTQAEALANPLNIPVERVVAKVNATLGDHTASGDYEVNGTTTTIKTKLLGWKVTETTPKSKLMKAINTSWTDVAWWNDLANDRSYWADSYVPTAGESYNYFPYNSIVTNNSTEYCLENTTTSTTEKTKLIVAAVLVDNTDTPIDLMEWKGTKYTSDGMKELLVSTSDMEEFLILTGLNYSTLPKDAVKFILPTGTTTKYNVIAALSDTYSSIPIFKRVAGGTPIAATAAEVNAAFAGLGEIKYWKGGASYFFVDIEHRGGDGFGAVGVVRNHSYNLTINSVTGLGTPVPDPETLPIDPERPDEDHSFLAATVSVLSWKTVSQSVDLN